jgi:hypothetical protein
MVVESLKTEVYHNICFFNLSRPRNISISTYIAVKPGAIISSSSGHPLEDPVEIAYTPDVDIPVYGWQTFKGVEGVVMEDGWMRYFIYFLNCYMCS